jgi:hypothetical protein
MPCVSHSFYAACLISPVATRPHLKPAEPLVSLWQHPHSDASGPSGYTTPIPEYHEDSIDGGIEGDVAEKWPLKFEQRPKVWSISPRRQSTGQREDSIPLS